MIDEKYTNLLKANNSLSLKFRQQRTVMEIVLSLFLILHKNIKFKLSMRKIRNFLCFFICSFHLNYPTTEEQITDRQVLLGVTQKNLPTVIGVLLRVTEQHRANTHPYLQANLLASIMGENPIGKTNKLGEQHFSSTERSFFSSSPFLKDLLFIFLIFTTMW